MNHLKGFKIFLEGAYTNASGESFWGDRGAGVLPFCKQTGRFLLALRSEMVNEPGTWGTWGGKMEIGETPKETATREMQEECGWLGEMSMVPLTTFRSRGGGFEFHNFLGVTPVEFEPNEDTDEVAEHRWMSMSEMRENDNLHFGLKFILENDMQTLNRWIRFSE